MSGVSVRLGIGSRLRMDGAAVEVAELHGTHVLLRDPQGRMMRLAIGDLLAPGRVTVIPDPEGPVSAPADSLATALAQLDPAQRDRLLERAAHLREVLTGYRSGTPELAGAGEPRAGYEPSQSLMQRYRAKAAELGVDVSTVRRWAAAYQRDGEAGLLDGRARTIGGAFRGVDARWAAACREVVDEHVDASTPTKSIVLRRVEARLTRAHGAGVVPLPSRATAYRFLEELTRGRNTFAGSAKARRSIANRPAGVYGRLRATRPGEYLLLDTTPLDVFAMEPVTLRWVGVQLTVALDLYSRCVAGVRLTPVSTKAMDVAAVVYQALQPPPAAPHWPAEAVWPYHGLPGAVVVDAGRLEGPMREAAGPALAPETLVVDHGRVYVSEHLTSVCERLGISIQPTRTYTPTDKAPLERWFRTLRQGLLEALPGYKGPDVFSRGDHVEDEAFFFLDELESIIQEWTAVVYHHRPHDALVDPHVPGVHLTPAQMHQHGIARAGYVQVPADPDLLYDFLPVVWRRVHHYGVEVHGLRYDGVALNGYRDRTSPYGGIARGRWPLHLNPDDVIRVYFQDPQTGRWHALVWEHAAALEAPFSAEALAYARKLAARTQRFPDDKRAVAELLERWNLGLAHGPAERRMALRLAAERAALQPLEPAGTQDQEVTRLASVQSVITRTSVPAEPVDELQEPPVGSDPDPDLDGAGRAGDDDDERELEADPDTGSGDYYADALDSLE